MPITFQQIAGDDIHGTADQNRPPVKIGGYAYDTVPSSVTVGQRVNAYFDLQGYQHIKIDGTVAVSGAGGGIQYTEGTVEDTLTGNIIMAEGSADTIRALQAYELTNSVYALKVGISDSAGNLISSFGGGTQYVEGTAAAAIVGTAAFAEGSANALRPIQVLELTTSIYALKAAIVDAAGNQITTFGSSTTTISNTVSALCFQGTSPWVTALTGTAAVTQSTSPWVVALTSSAVTISNTISSLSFQGTSPWSVALTGTAAVTQSTSPWSVALTGTAAVTQSTSPWVVSMTGTASVDTELPAAAALADNTANPTVPGVGAYLMGFESVGATWDRILLGSPSADNIAASSLQGLLGLNTMYAFDGTNFDRVRLEGSLLGVMVGGSTADAATEAGQPISNGYTARTTNRIAVSDGQRVRGIADDIGRQVVRMGQVRDLMTKATVLAATTASTTLLSGVAGAFLDLVSIDLSNDSQFSVRVTLFDNSTTAAVYALAPKQTLMKSWTRPFDQAATNTAWIVQLNTNASVYITAQAERNV